MSSQCVVTSIITYQSKHSSNPLDWDTAGFFDICTKCRYWQVTTSGRALSVEAWTGKNVNKRCWKKGSVFTDEILVAANSKFYSQFQRTTTFKIMILFYVALLFVIIDFFFFVLTLLNFFVCVFIISYASCNVCFFMFCKSLVHAKIGKHKVKDIYQVIPNPEENYQKASFAISYTETPHIDFFHPAQLFLALV